MDEVDTSNDYMVGVQGDGIMLLMPIVGRIPKAKALRLAAWIASAADYEGKEFDAVLEAVRNT